MFGHCDLAGNVWEWSADAWREDQAEDDPAKVRVLRGGAWYGPAQDLEAADRDRFGARRRSGGLGFRLCCAASEP